MVRFAKHILYALCLAACGVETNDLVSWEEFKASATHHVDGREIFVVEWDQPVSEAELRKRYDAYVHHAELAADGFGQREQESIVNDVGWEDDIWRFEQQLNLTYCV